MSRSPSKRRSGRSAGPNGANKTTSFYMIVGLVRAAMAAMCRLMANRSPAAPCTSARAWACPYPPQEASLFRKLNVADNIRAVLELQKCRWRPPPKMRSSAS